MESWHHCVGWLGLERTACWWILLSSLPEGPHTFASANSTIHFDNGSHGDKKIRTRTYVAPDGTQWRTNPVPACISSASEYPIHGSPTPDCPMGTMFEAVSRSSRKAS